MEMKLRKIDVMAIKVLLAVVVVCGVMFCLVGCQSIPGASVTGTGDDDGTIASKDGKKFTFTLKANVNAAGMGEPVVVDLGNITPVGKSSSLTENEQNLTDVWVLDYMDGYLMQQVHQSATDSDWGKPVMTLAYGSHHVYFVASRGTEPALSTDEHTLTWAKVGDTFWTDYEVEVVNTSNGNRAVTLDRVVSRLRVTVTDEIPAGCANITVTPAVWYSVLDYLTGEAVNAAQKVSVVNVPAAYVGTVGQLTVYMYSVSPSSDWSTDVTMQVKDSNGGVLGQASVVGAPMKRNRSTDFSGQMFGSTGSTAISLNDDWLEPYIGTW